MVGVNVGSQYQTDDEHLQPLYSLFDIEAFCHAILFLNSIYPVSSETGSFSLPYLCDNSNDSSQANNFFFG
jgi:hypothetical protein